MFPLKNLARKGLTYIRDLTVFQQSIHGWFSVCVYIYVSDRGGVAVLLPGYATESKTR